MLNTIENLLKNKSENSVILQHHFDSHYSYQIENNIHPPLLNPFNEQDLTNHYEKMKPVLDQIAGENYSLLPSELQKPLAPLPSYVNQKYAGKLIGSDWKDKFFNTIENLSSNNIHVKMVNKNPLCEKSGYYQRFKGFSTKLNDIIEHKFNMESFNEELRGMTNLKDSLINSGNDRVEENLEFLEKKLTFTFDKFSNLEIYGLEKYVQEFEQISLTVLQPSIISLIGVSSFIVLHNHLKQNGSFKEVILNSIKFRKSYTLYKLNCITGTYSNNRIKFFNRGTVLYRAMLKTITKPTIQTIIIGSSTLSMVYKYFNVGSTVLLKPILETLLTSKEGTGKADSLLDLVGKVAFDIGSAGGTISTNLFLGFLKKNEPVLTFIVDYVDKHMGKK